MNAPFPSWLVFYRDGQRKHPRSRMMESRVETTIVPTANPDARHTLRGEHGRKILEAIAAEWNRCQFKTSTVTSWCIADGGRRRLS